MNKERTIEEVKELTVYALRRAEVKRELIQACADPEFNATEVEKAVAEEEYKIYRYFGGRLLKILAGVDLYEDSDLLEIASELEKEALQ